EDLDPKPEQLPGDEPEFRRHLPAPSRSPKSFIAEAIIINLLPEQSVSVAALFNQMNRKTTPHNVTECANPKCRATIGRGRAGRLCSACRAALSSGERPE
ncbi:MAG: hypothetical protein NT069_29215, partial [Planctomycetota bacterium]|nr:hypothetical protein [Planctomycetota bacterium]